jgi:hypothetical protein
VSKNQVNFCIDCHRGDCKGCEFFSNQEVKPMVRSLKDEERRVLLVNAQKVGVTFSPAVSVTKKP